MLTKESLLACLTGLAKHGALRAGAARFFLGGLLAVGVAHGQILYNTGVDENNDGRDDHYSYLGTTTFAGILPSGGAAVNVNALIDPGTAWPIFGSSGAWFDNTAESSWLRPGTELSQATLTTNNGAVQSIFVFKTTFVFDASLYDLTTSKIVFKSAADNILNTYLDNANYTHLSLFAVAEQHNSFMDFTSVFELNYATGLRAGFNELYFYVTNVANSNGSSAGNPSGFRLEVDTVVSSLIPIPESSTYGILGGAGLLGLMMWRRRRVGAEKHVALG